MDRYGLLSGFEAQGADDVPGVRVTAKICELCGKGFFRVAAERECEVCKMRVAAIAVAQVLAKKAERNESWRGHEAVVRKGTQPQMTAAQQAVWDAWLADKQANGLTVRRRAKGPGLVQTPEERERRRNEWRREHRLKMGMKPHSHPRVVGLTPEERRLRHNELVKQSRARKRAMHKMSTVAASATIQ